MRKIEKVLRLHHAGRRSNREIAQAVRVSPTTVADYLRRARQAGLTSIRFIVKPLNFRSAI